MASKNTAASDSELMNCFPTAAATIPAISTVDQRAKIIFGLYPALVSIAALTAASGMPPRNMPSISVTDKLLNP